MHMLVCSGELSKALVETMFEYEKNNTSDDPEDDKTE